MAWVRFDDKRATHRKLREAGFEARGMDEAAICWCADEETDGFISDDDVAVLAALHHCKNVKRLTDKLIEVDRWARDDVRKGFTIHDFLHYHPTRNQLELRRESDRNRKRNLNGIHPEEVAESK